MTPELHQMLSQQRHDELMAAAERDRAARRTRTPDRPGRRARLVVRFVPAFMRPAPGDASRPRRSRWAEGGG
jgi:hypothetical protein